METVKTFFEKELFRVDGFHVTVAAVVVVVLVWFLFFKR